MSYFTLLFNLNWDQWVVNSHCGLWSSLCVYMYTYVCMCVMWSFSTISIVMVMRGGALHTWLLGDVCDNRKWISFVFLTLDGWGGGTYLVVQVFLGDWLTWCITPSITSDWLTPTFRAKMFASHNALRTSNGLSANVGLVFSCQPHVTMFCQYMEHPPCVTTRGHSCGGGQVCLARNV